MTTSKVEIEVSNVISVVVTNESMTVELDDGRAMSVPLGWFPRLLHAMAKERNNWELIGGGQGVHWTDLDEDINVEGLLAGRRSSESQSSLKRWLESRTKK